VRVVLKQITKFFIIGVSAVLVDLVIYYFMSDILSLNTDISKASGFLVGTVYTYYLNKMWTWRYTEKSNKGMVFMFGLVYGISFVFNILINKFGLVLIPEFEVSLKIDSASWHYDIFAIKGGKFLAFFIATITSAIINFLGQKFLVFNKVKFDPKDETNIEVFSGSQQE
jgi:putative flippase GtrA